MHYQPNILATNLDVVFCGINPAATAAAAGHNFSHASNRFWRVLHLSGFTDVLLAAEDERHLLAYRCGITAVVEKPTKSAVDVPAAEFRKARRQFKKKIVRYAPRVAAFLGKRGYAAMTTRHDLAWGLQPDAYANTKIWILPNPSGLNRRFTTGHLVSAYAMLRAYLRQE